MLPIIKWAGGKRRFTNQIISIIGNEFKNYYEPFVGGGAVLFALEAKNAKCSDINDELINFYNTVKTNPNELINELENNFLPYHSSEFYYKVRKLDRDSIKFNSLTQIQRAARFLYLNKTCYNGLWRVNRNGQNNVPFGRYVNPKILCSEEIINASRYFNDCNVTFEVNDYKVIANKVKPGDFVYFDPPYDIEIGQNSFVEYTQSGFNRDEQIKLKKLCDKLVKKGVIVGVSNSNTNFIRELYQNGKYNFYTLHEDITVKRTIGSTKKSRREIIELFIVGRLNNEKDITSSK